MPTDENNGVNPQNQQVDPNLTGNQSVQNSGASDDFDFNFDDSNNNQSTQAGTGLSGDMQDQMRRQGRSGMFLTPDEAITKSNEDNDMALGNIDISSTVQPQHRSGMFLTPDEEANKEESTIEGKSFNFQDVSGNGDSTENKQVDEDSYLADIDPSDVEDSPQDIPVEEVVEEEPEVEDKLDDDIEDLISFDDNPTPVVESTPAVESAPVVESVPVAESTPVVESAPVVESTPVVESAPAVESTPVVESAPAVESTPVVENVPVVESTQSNDSNIASDNVQVDGASAEEISSDVQSNIQVPSEENSGDNIVMGNDGDVVQNTQNLQQTDNVINDGGNVSSQDWLAQEDKKVEETFGSTETNNDVQNMNVNVPVDNVVQNVENLITTEVDATENISGNSALGETGQLQVETQVENIGNQAEIQGNLDGDLGAQTEIQSSEPSEHEFSQMSNLLNSSNPGQIDLNNVQVGPENQIGGEDTGGQNGNNGLESINQNVDLQENVAPSNEEQVEASSVPGNLIEEPKIAIENVSGDVQPQQESQASGTLNLDDLVSQNNTVSDNQVQVNSNVSMDVNAGVSADLSNNVNNSVDTGSFTGTVQQPEITNVQEGNNVQGGISLDAIVDKEINNLTETPAAPGIIGTVNQNQESQVVQQPQNVKKKKKQSGFTVIGIFLGVVVLLGILGFVAYKMFPEEFSKIFNKNDPVVGYLLGDTENVGIDENGSDQNNVEDINLEDVENSGDNVEVQEPDPDSLAGLLQGDDENPENIENSGNVENNELNNGEENGDSEISGESNEIGENIGLSGEDNAGNFDPFADVDQLLDKDQELIDKLNDYKTKGQYYSDLGNKDGKTLVAAYGDYIVKTAQEQISKLENGEEIDINLFDVFDEKLENLAKLAN